jgi:hypothetical protein
MDMAVTVKLSDQLIEHAKLHANIYHRSIPKQIEYWSNIGKLVEENPDLPYSFIKDIIFSLQESKTRAIETYSFDKD